MNRFAIVLLGLSLLSPGVLCQTKDKPEPKKIPPQVAELLKLSPQEFLKRFDKNKDGVLTKDELPEFLAKNFDKYDLNGDGKLGPKEIVQMQQAIAKFFGASSPKKEPPGLDAIVDNLLRQFDKDNDGKISKAEAKGKLLDAFAVYDKNKDGYLDRQELRALAAVLQKTKKGPFPVGPPDFDAFDKNADGRLTKDELKGTPYYDRFSEIDTNGDGRIDRDEFEAFLKKQGLKKDKKQ